MMDINNFIQSINENHPPAGLSALLRALWYDAKGDWEKSHNIAQDINTKEGALIHAYLHRKEGDEWNAEYWYRRNGLTRPEATLEEEWLLLFNMFATT